MNPLFKSENPFDKALPGLLLFAELLLLVSIPPPPTLRKPFVNAEVDLEKAESKTLPDLLVSSLAESSGLMTAVVNVLFERAEKRYDPD